MSLSPMATELVTAYEQEHSQELAELALRIEEHILKVGKMLRELGLENAQEGNKPYPADVFPELVVKSFGLNVELNHETVQAVADLWQSDYMDGYDAAIDLQ